MDSHNIKKRWNSPHLKIGNSIISGRGIYSKKPIKRNEVIMIWGGIIFTIEEVRAGKGKPNSLTGFDEGLFLGQPLNSIDTIDQYLNHSCDPNLWMLDEVTIAAKRDIGAGEELTADYALWELDDKWIMPEYCNCCSPKCRRTITGSDWQLVELQKRYKNHFLPCINKRIKNNAIKYQQHKIVQDHNKCYSF